MSLFYGEHDVFATYTRIPSLVLLLVNEEFFHHSSFELIKNFFYHSSLYLSNFVHQCRGLLTGGSGGDLAPSLWGRKFFADKIFFSEKISIFTPKISDDFFSHRPGFSDFRPGFSDFPYLYCV